MSSRNWLISLEVTDPKHDLGSGEAGHEGDDPERAAPGWKVRGTGNLLRLVVASLHQDVGTDAEDQVPGRVLPEENQRIDEPEGGEKGGAPILGDQRSIGPLEAADALVGIEADHKPIAQRASAGKIRDMAGMDQVEAAVRKDETEAARAAFLQESC